MQQRMNPHIWFLRFALRYQWYNENLLIHLRWSIQRQKKNKVKSMNKNKRNLFFIWRNCCFTKNSCDMNIIRAQSFFFTSLFIDFPLICLIIYSKEGQTIEMKSNLMSEQRNCFVIVVVVENIRRRFAKKDLNDLRYLLFHLISIQLNLLFYSKESSW